ncbi:MAG: SRPBCC family protein [Acidobacteriaceae bacterium]
MQNQTVTRAAEADFGPAEIYDVLVQVNNIPAWAPVFADAIEPIDDGHYRVTKGGDTFRLEVVSHLSAGAVDYIREMTDNKRGGAYIRVTPRPLGGSTITMTVPLGPNTTESEVARVVDQELAELIRLARPRLRQVG